MKHVNLQDPFQGRRWLNLVVPDDGCGFRLKPNLVVPRDHLGFSCSTNRLGLRGPCDERASNVVFGTSYALGIAVDDGQNWHDLALPSSGWLNLGLPVGIQEWRELANRYHHGSKQRALLIYHPNIWAHCLMYERWRRSGKDVFDALSWRRDVWGCAKLSVRRWRRRPGKLRRGEIIRFEHAGERFEIDPLYARIRPDEHRDLIDRNLGVLLELLRPFEEVWCARVPVKQELVPAAYGNNLLKETVATYDALWGETRKRLSTLPGIRFVELGIFVLGDYQPCDSHWNARGNARFADWVKSCLLQASQDTTPAAVQQACERSSLRCG